MSEEKNYILNNQVKRPEYKRPDGYTAAINIHPSDLIQKQKTIEDLEMELQTSKKKLAIANKTTEEIRNNYILQNCSVEEAIEHTWHLYDMVIKKEEIEKEDIRMILSLLMQN